MFYINNSTTNRSFQKFNMCTHMHTIATKYAQYDALYMEASNE